MFPSDRPGRHVASGVVGRAEGTVRTTRTREKRRGAVHRPRGGPARSTWDVWREGWIQDPVCRHELPGRAAGGGVASGAIGASSMCRRRPSRRAPGSCSEGLTFVSTIMPERAGRSRSKQTSSPRAGSLSPAKLKARQESPDGPLGRRTFLRRRKRAGRGWAWAGRQAAQAPLAPQAAMPIQLDWSTRLNHVGNHQTGAARVTTDAVRVDRAGAAAELSPILARGKFQGAAVCRGLGKKPVQRAR